MRKLKLQMHTTLDGFVARPNGEGDWIWIGEQDPAGLEKVIELAESCDTILMGRKMSADFLPHWEQLLEKSPDHPLARLMVSMPKIVFSHTLKEIPGKNVRVE